MFVIDNINNYYYCYYINPCSGGCCTSATLRRSTNWSRCASYLATASLTQPALPRISRTQNQPLYNRLLQTRRHLVLSPQDHAKLVACEGVQELRRRHLPVARVNLRASLHVANCSLNRDLRGPRGRSHREFQPPPRAAVNAHAQRDHDQRQEDHSKVARQRKIEWILGTKRNRRRTFRGRCLGDGRQREEEKRCRRV